MRKLIGPLVLGLVLQFPLGANAQEAQVYKNVSNDKLEKILGDLNIQFKKSAGNKDGIFFYDFARNNFQIRLSNYNGLDLWIDALFNDKMSLEEVNGWNRRAKFSRAVLTKVKDKDTVSLECQVDCVGGITDANIRQLVLRFDQEVLDFVAYVKTLPVR